jgi:hypothetical protein
LSLSTIFLLDLGTVPTVCYFILEVYLRIALSTTLPFVHLEYMMCAFSLRPSAESEVIIHKAIIVVQVLLPGHKFNLSINSSLCRRLGTN